ncbi:MAG: molybdopterin oxidoreductase family protein [Actinomycetota bacterium]|nr:molybdopterin oxidoreductase family protein [Actinomycetota bacterium]
MSTSTHFRTCPFCEATCGLRLEVSDEGTVESIRGDSEDVLSAGFLCPKAFGLKELREDPDRLRAPLVRRDGELREASWPEAFAAVEAGLAPLLEEHGRDAVAVYAGNPNAHNLSAMVYLQVLLRALGSKNVYSASSVDQMPKHFSAGHMFGHWSSIPVPDIDRTDYLMIWGANPLVSNGSLLTAPDMRGRIRRIRERGGKVVVIDPRRTRTAEHADEHHFIRPGTDALALFALVSVLLSDGLADPGPLADLIEGLAEVEELAAPFTPERVESACGIPAAELRRMARELAQAECAAVYGRIGTTVQEFGTLSSWLVDVLNVLSGSFDQPGGAMFTRAAAAQRNSVGEPGQGRGVVSARWGSRVRGLPEVLGELPVSALAEEIDTPGEGQVRALVTVAGNPLVSTPNAARLAHAVEGLDFMVAVDIYLNETTSHADVVLPSPDPLARSHYDLALLQFAARNVANYSPPVLERDEGLIDESEIFLRLTGIVTGQGAECDTDAIDDAVAGALVARETGTVGGIIEGRDPGDILAALEPRRGADRVLDLLLRTGAHGDGFGADPAGLTLDRLEAEPHGIDLGALEPRLPEVLRTRSGKIELAPEAITRDVPRLSGRLADGAWNGSGPEMVLIGRRQLRSNNSWMHNLNALVKGKDRCTALVNPLDAERLGISDGGRARVRSAAGEIEVPVEVSDEMMPGVVSVPHGWGHDVDGVRMAVASGHPGVNSNLLADESGVDAPSGNAVLNGIPVELEPAPAG